MTPHLRLAHRTRLRFVLLAVCALLLQQLAIAAHACTLDIALAQPVMAGHCEQAPVAPEDLQALCDQHCTHQATVASNAHAPTVPPAMLPALPPGTATVASLATRSLAVPSNSPAWPPPLPVTLRFCTLQI